MAHDGTVAWREDLNNNKQHVARNACFTNHEYIPTYLISIICSRRLLQQVHWTLLSRHVMRKTAGRAKTRYAPKPEIASGRPASSRCC